MMTVMLIAMMMVVVKYIERLPRIITPAHPADNRYHNLHDDFNHYCMTAAVLDIMPSKLRGRENQHLDQRLTD